MHTFHIRYRNTQGTLMRILNAASRRGIDMPYVQASPLSEAHTVTLLLEVNAKQIGQLSRDWYAIVDVTDVRSDIPSKDLAEKSEAWAAAPHPPSSAVSSGSSLSSAATA
jgi:acetolactate synthase small subunit